MQVGALTEPTSGPPIDPVGPRSGVMEAVNRRGAGHARSVARSPDLAGRAVAAKATITTTIIASHGGYRHC
jgi:hypothetical protein